MNASPSIDVTIDARSRALRSGIVTYRRPGRFASRRFQFIAQGSSIQLYCDGRQLAADARPELRQAVREAVAAWINARAMPGESPFGGVGA